MKLHFLGIKEITLFPYPQCKKVLVISVSRTSLYKRYSKANESFKLTLVLVLNKFRSLNLLKIVLQKDTVTNICQAADKQLFTLVEWAKRIPHFTELPLEDQVILLRAGRP